MTNKSIWNLHILLTKIIFTNKSTFMIYEAYMKSTEVES